VELSISYVGDWAIEGLGAFVDDVRVTAGATDDAPSWEDGLGPWRVAGSPPGSPPNDSDWTRTGPVYEEAAGVSTPDTILLGFGLEGVAGAEARAAIMGRAMRHLLRRE
jgi:hypothetical protein